MASGAATRFGGNKLMANLGGMPLIQHVVNATAGLFACRVVVTRHEDVARLCRELGTEAILHNEPARNDTVRLGMQAIGGGKPAQPSAQAADGCDTVTFFQADQPLISTHSITALLAASESDPASIWRASFANTPGAPVLFPAWAFEELRNLPTGKGGSWVVKAHADRVRWMEVASEWELADVDTPDDLRMLQEHMG